MTTDDQQELFDHVNDRDEVVGRITRAQAHSGKHLLHRSVGVLVFNSRGEIYLHQRSQTKDTDPGKWNISTAGHVAAGKTYAESAVRELFEELGIKTKLTVLGKIIVKTTIETEIQQAFQSVYDGPFFLSPSEVQAGRFFHKEELEQLIRTNALNVTVGSQIALQKYAGIFPGQAQLLKYILKVF